MLDFLIVSSRSAKNKTIEIYPKFLVKSSNDLMIRGSDFYAIWDDKHQLWSKNEEVALQLIDEELDQFASEHKDLYSECNVKILHMWDSDSGSVERWHRYVQKHMWDSYHALDEKLIFSNTNVTKQDYASKKLDYPLEEGSTDAYDELMSTLYSEEERRKIEWAIGSVVSGDSKVIQKFLVLYGSAGTGKSTVLNIIQDLFKGYYSVFDARALGSVSNIFALEAFKDNPLVAIQHDGDLSRIEDNTRLNSVVSHEWMTVNEKFKSTYSNRFNSFLFMGTNKPVKITDAKSGIIRRLIDVSPTGKKIPPQRYRALVSKIKFELGAIAYHCLQVYLSDPGRYDDYIPVSMLGASNDFYNYILDSYDTFKSQDGTTLKAAWEMYKAYCDDARVQFPYSQKNFKEELKNYFKNFEERAWTDDETRVRNWYSGFIFDKFASVEEEKPKIPEWLNFRFQHSLFDDICADFPAQLATEDEKPSMKWADVTTKLKDIDTTKVHYVKLPLNYITIDFDLKDSDGKKSAAKNIEAASKWPETYGELSKSGEGIHLEYFYDGDARKLQRLYSEGIEVKVNVGNSSLRRRLTKCNDIPVATINSGLPLKEETKVVNTDVVKTEKGLRKLIIRNLRKEIHPGTKPSIDFIFKILEDAYESDLKYDVSDLEQAVFSFAANSTHQSSYCVNLVNHMKFKSKDISENVEIDEEAKLVFFDVEVFPNLFVVVWKAENATPVSWINPTPQQIEELIKFKLVGFNNRRYDNHILWGRLMGYTDKELYLLSQKIINGNRNAFFGEAYNISYTDIYDFSSEKKSLKKFEIELGIHHLELGLPWDQDVPEDKWQMVADYCINDVVATEAVFKARAADFKARQILADVADMTVNDTTNSLTTKIIFGLDRNPQSQFKYRNLAELFPGYSFEAGVSTYRGEVVGEGGYVYSEPGMYENVVTFDVASMHPSSIIAENLFGDEYTQKFKELLDARIAIKHKDYEAAKKMLGGKLAKYLDDESQAKSLSQALKIAINSVYGLTAANFNNPFHDPRNIDNIVAKRGALFMVNLKHEVQDRGYQVVHIKTDSIKVVNPDNDISNFIMEYGKSFGYTFEIEDVYERFCLVNDAVYIAKCSKDDPEHPGQWTATGAQFQVPYIFKTLFSKEPIAFEDMCETKSVTSSLYLDLNENLPEGEHDYHFVGRVGQFTPIKPGGNGGELFREKDGKYYAVGGTKGYRWLESETVRLLHKEDLIDTSYYDRLVDEAVEDISKFGDFEYFTRD